jgi:cytochrome oxidase Cu insertion factor (SCO1/SenC/PrrC family)
MKHMHPIKIIAGLMLGLALAMNAPKAADSAPLEKTGLGVGQAAPDWKLSDQNGKKHTLRSLIQKGPVALVFYRSANW